MYLLFLSFFLISNSYHVSAEARTVYKKKDKVSGTIKFSDNPKGEGWVKEKLKGNVVIDKSRKKKRAKDSKGRKLGRSLIPSTLPVKRTNVIEEKRIKLRKEIKSALNRFKELKSEILGARSKRRANPTRRNKTKLELLEDELVNLKKILAQKKKREQELETILGTNP